jgi:hypothetical protein
MFGNRHYVPVLKDKQGERLALRHLPAGTKARFTPLFDIVRDFDDLNDLPDGLLRDWGAATAFVDLGGQPDSAMPDGRHPVQYVFEEASALGLNLIPVVGLGASQVFLQATRTVVASDGRGVCIRITVEDKPADQLAARLLGLRQALRGNPEAGGAGDALPESQVDLVVDLSVVAPIDVGMITAIAEGMLRACPTPNAWRTLTLVSGAFPESRRGIASNGQADVPRKDWLAWRSICSTYDGRIPTFGDYGAVHPIELNLDFSQITPAGNIRYTVSGAWLVVKGSSLRDNGFAQYRDLSARVVADPRYCSEAFSPGDRYILDCAQGRGSTGSPMTWVQAATSHHLTFVGEELASLPAS